MHCFKFSQVSFHRRRIAILGCIDGFENQVGHARHGRDDNNHSVLLRGLADDLSASAEPSGIAYRSATKLHHDETLSVHSVLPKFWVVPVLFVTGTGRRVTHAP